MVFTPQRIFAPGHTSEQTDTEDLLNREWLVTNGLGGYASSTLSGINTWRYHGLLISAEPTPLGRILVVKSLSEQIRFKDGRILSMTGEEMEPGRLDIPAVKHLEEFRLEYGIPTWRYKVEDVEIERTIMMPHHQNSVFITYKILKAPEHAQLELRPYVLFSAHEAGYDVNSAPLPFALQMRNHHYEVSAGPNLPTLRMSLQSERTYFVTEGGMSRDIFFRKDAERGYDARSNAWTPGFFHVTVTPGQELTLILSTEAWSSIEALKPYEALAFEKERRMRLIERADPCVKEDEIAGELVLAADQFLFEPQGRLRDKVQAQAMDDKVRAVIAGYHWFTDWGPRYDDKP